MIFKDKIKKFKLFICVNIILATIIGMYAQDISYYYSGDYSVNNAQLYLYLLTILTAFSIILFFTTPILIYRFTKKISAEKRVFTIYLIADILIGILTSMSSVFILAMSWG